MNMGTYRCKLPIISLLLVACSLVLLTSRIAISAKERRIALVIGNGAYKSSPLSNPVNDANDMAAALKKLGFSVKLRINANQRSMENSIRAFGKDLRSGGVGLFYFAGHGLQVHGRNYLIPIDANIESEADVKFESVDAGRVLSQMYEAENGLNIIILDACRDNPYGHSFRTSEKGLAKMDAPTGSILAYATAPNSVAADGTGRNGLYTSMLLKHINTPGLEIGRLFRQVRIDVVKSSDKRQTPWESSSLMGDFYFNNKRGISVVQFPIDTGADKGDMGKIAYGKVDVKSKLKLAVFPFLEVNVVPSTIEDFKRFTKFIINFTNDIPKIDFSYSYYPYDRDHKSYSTKSIENLIDENAIGEIWYNSQSRTKRKPDFKILKKLSNIINPDLILTFKISPADGLAGGQDGTTTCRGFLFDVERNIYYDNIKEAKDSIISDFGLIEEMTKDLLNTYIHSNPQIRAKY